MPSQNQIESEKPFNYYALSPDEKAGLHETERANFRNSMKELAHAQLAHVATSSEATSQQG